MSGCQARLSPLFVWPGLPAASLRSTDLNPPRCEGTARIPRYPKKVGMRSLRMDQGATLASC